MSFDLETIGSGILAVALIIALAKLFCLWDDRRVNKDKIRFK